MTGTNSSRAYVLLRRAYRLIGPLCLIGCAGVIVLFTVSIIRSKHTLPARLEDSLAYQRMGYDTSGIHALTIEGTVIDTEHAYAYDFRLSPDGAQVTTRVAKSIEDVTREEQSGGEGRIYPYFNPSRIGDIFEARYYPVEPVRTETTFSDNGWIVGTDGKRQPLQEYRVYADIFEVIPCLRFHEFPLVTEPPLGKLYREAGPDEYIYTYLSENPNDSAYTVGYLQSRFNGESGVRLSGEIRMGDRVLTVPTGRGLFGHTAVYAVDMPDNIIPTVQDPAYALSVPDLPDAPFEWVFDGDINIEPVILAEVLFPITLARGTDEILGFMALENDALLLIRRGGDLEITRFDPYAGIKAITTAEGVPDYFEYFLTGDSLVIYDSIQNDRQTVWTFDLTGGGLRPVHAGVEIGYWWKVSGSSAYVDITGHSIVKDGVLYAVRYTYYYDGFFPSQLYIVAINERGELIGECRVQCGVDEDAPEYRAGSALYRSDYARRLQSITLR